MSDETRDVLEGLSNYTAGPWEADGYYVKPKGRELAVSASASVGFTPEETYANTEIQARAPDLVEEIRKLRAENERLRERIRCARDEMAALVPKPRSVDLDDWPCDNPADRKCLQSAWGELNRALLPDTPEDR
jgi:hypothetical protein